MKYGDDPTVEVVVDNTAPDCRPLQQKLKNLQIQHRQHKPEQDNGDTTPHNHYTCTTICRCTKEAPTPSCGLNQNPGSYAGHQCGNYSTPT